MIAHRSARFCMASAYSGRTAIQNLALTRHSVMLRLHTGGYDRSGGGADAPVSSVDTPSTGGADAFGDEGADGPVTGAPSFVGANPGPGSIRNRLSVARSDPRRQSAAATADDRS